MRISEVPANVLLVTDDPGVFDLRERLSDARELWGVSSVPTAQKALAQLEGDSPIDAVVVGHRVADSDSRTLLESLRTSFPDVARIAIATSPAVARALENARVADSAVEIPVDAAELQHVLERTVTLNWRMHDPQLLSLMADITALPTPPAAITQLATALGEPQVEIGEVANIIASDPALTARLLQLVNSAAFGLGQRMTKLDQVVAYLGLSTVRTVLSAMELLGSFHAIEPELRLDVELHRTHAMAVAEFAHRLPDNARVKHDAFAAGMLHDIGLLALLACAPLRYQAVKAEIQAGRELESAELEILGTSHSSIGAYILDQWMFPTTICEAVGRSHDADMMTDHQPDATAAVFVAEQFVSSQPGDAWWETGTAVAPSYLEAMGWTQRVRT